jgi:hypothetical protein
MCTSECAQSTYNKAMNLLGMGRNKGKAEEILKDAGLYEVQVFPVATALWIQYSLFLRMPFGTWKTQIHMWHIHMTPYIPLT